MRQRGADVLALTAIPFDGAPVSGAATAIVHSNRG